MAVPEPREIEWNSARFGNRVLTVELSGKGSKEWNSRFATVLSLLDPRHDDWGEAKLIKNRIRVADVRQGAEHELRHFLESVVLQANSDVEPEGASHVAGDDPDGEPANAVDEQMTATFRSFGSD
jgi:hypothetical protein